MSAKKHGQPGWLAHRSEQPSLAGLRPLLAGEDRPEPGDVHLYEQTLTPGQHFEQTRHPDLLLYVLTGAGLLMRADEAVAVINGDCAKIPANVGFYLQNHSESDLVVLLMATQSIN